MSRTEVTNRWRSDAHRGTAEIARGLAALNATMLAGTWLLGTRLSSEMWMLLAGCRAAYVLGGAAGAVSWWLSTAAAKEAAERDSSVQRREAVVNGASAARLIAGTARFAWLCLSLIR